MENYVAFTATFMSLAIPIVFIVFACLVSINKKKREKEIRQLIIENNVEMERAKMLLEEPEKKNNMYGNLRGGLIFFGVGLGALADYLLGIDVKNLYFYLIIAVGVGIGMLTAFFVELKLAERKVSRKEEREMPLGHISPY